MACPDVQKDIQNCSQKRKTAIFYKMIDDSTMIAKNLIIPENFVMKYGDELSVTATLKVIDWPDWQVGLRKVKHKLWFSHGWPEFVEHHSIHLGSFLVFAYSGNSHFDVYIYDLSTGKIHQPSTLSCRKESKPDQTQGPVICIDLFNSKPFETLSSSLSETPAALRKKNIWEECKHKLSTIKALDPEFAKTVGKSSYDSDSGILNSDRSESPPEGRESDSDLSWSMSLEMGNAGEALEDDIKESKRAKTKRTKITYSQRSNSSKTTADNHSVIKNAQMPQGPRVASVTFMGCTQNTAAHVNTTTVSHTDERSPAKPKVTSSSAVQSTQSSCKITKAMNITKFYEMVQENEITINGKEDDIKLSSEDNRKEKLYATKRTSRLFSRRATAEEKERAILAAHVYITGKPCCRIPLRPSYIKNGYVRLSAEFASTHLSGVSGSIILETSNGKKWHVRCIQVDGYARLSRGWLKFIKENQLKEGDVCVFELIQERNVILKVTFFRALEYTGPEKQV